MKTWYQLSAKEALMQMGVERRGLTTAQAEHQREIYGENVLKEEPHKPIWVVFLEQFKDLLVVILIVAALISMVSDNVESTVVIFTVLILNAILGTVQYQKAEKSLDSLKSMSSPTVRVLRDGHKTEILSQQVVPGDIMLLEAGDLVVADGRILECYGMQVNESSLTGESVLVKKQTDRLIEDNLSLGDQSNRVFSGSLVASGRGVALVTSIGMDTELGKIAQLMNETEDKRTPLQVSLDQFGGKLAAAIMVISALVFCLSLYRNMPVLDSLMFAVALAVAAIPEALGTIVTIVQAMGTQKMARENAVVKELKAVESLGCVSVICTDKTGTLTQNCMTVEEVYGGHKVFSPSCLDLSNRVHRYLLYGSILTNDAVRRDDKAIGDPTEYALLDLGHRVGWDEEKIREKYPRLGEIPFDSDRKLMSTLHRLEDGEVLLTKGALDVLLERSCEILDSTGPRPIRSSDRQKLLAQNLAWSKLGLRVLAMAYKPAERSQIKAMGLEVEQDYVFVGMTAMMDPPRPESKNAVLSAKRAGIKPVMITGDHKITATAIAEKIGLYEDGELTVTGTELEAMSEEELAANLDRISVYARVLPEHKIRIVKAWQKKGCITAMTGDGVNDAPALKQADIGVAMGITGTEVSKDASAMILMDDNFATIIKAVANGRNVYRNIRNAIQFLLSGNMAGILSVLYTSLLALPVPFEPVHLLFINLLTDSLPALAIGMEPAEEDLLKQPPRNPREGILTGRFMAAILIQGGLIAVCTMMAYYTGLRTSGAGVASTMAFSTLTLARLFHGFNCRSEHSIIRLGFKGNLYSVTAFEVGVLLLAAVLFVPGLQQLFSVADLSLRQLGTIGIFAVVPTVLIQAWKTVRESLG